MKEKIKLSKLSLNSKIAILVLLPIIVFIGLRILQGFGYMKTYFAEVFQILLYKRNETYEERQFKTMGVRYLYPKNMADVTPEKTVICFWERNAEIDPGVDAYFLYPRIVRIIDIKESPIDQIKDLGCGYLVLNNKYPNFDMKIKKVIIFGKGLDDLPIEYTINTYDHDNPMYQNKTGLLKI